MTKAVTHGRAQRRLPSWPLILHALLMVQLHSGPHRCNRPRQTLREPVGSRRQRDTAGTQRGQRGQRGTAGHSGGQRGPQAHLTDHISSRLCSTAGHTLLPIEKNPFLPDAAGSQQLTPPCSPPWDAHSGVRATTLPPVAPDPQLRAPCPSHRSCLVCRIYVSGKTQRSDTEKRQ